MEPANPSRTRAMPYSCVVVAAIVHAACVFPFRHFGGTADIVLKLALPASSGSAVEAMVPPARGAGSAGTGSLMLDQAGY